MRRLSVAVLASIALGCSGGEGPTGPGPSKPTHGGGVSAVITASGSPTNLTPNTSQQESPAVSGDVVVWVDHRTGNADIWGCNIAGGLDACASGAVNLTNDPFDQVEPAVSGSIVVWRDTRLGPTNHEIYGCDISAAAGGLAHCADHAVDLSNTIGLQFMPAMSGSLVVWYDTHLTGSTSPTADVSGCDVSGGLQGCAPVRLTPDTARANYTVGGGVAVAGDLVVWPVVSGTNSDIYGCRTTAGLGACSTGLVNLTQNSFGQHSPAADGNTVVWIDHRLGTATGPNVEVFGCDVASGLAGCASGATRLTDFPDPGGPGHAAVSGGVVAYDGAGIFACDVTGALAGCLATSIPLSQTGAKPAVSGNLVVWQGPGPGGDNDIFAVRVAPQSVGCSLQAAAAASLDATTGGYIPTSQQNSARFPPLVDLDATATESSGCGTLTYTWHWTQNDGSLQTSSGQRVPAKIDPGTRVVTLEVTSGTARSTATVSVRVPDLVVLVHGFMGSEASFGQLGPILFAADGSTVMPFDYSQYTGCFSGTILSIPALADKFGTWLEAKVLGPGGPGYQGHIDVITHSMGGLVVRAWMAGLQDSPEGPPFLPTAPAYVPGTFRRAVTLGTPHYGTRITQSLLTALCVARGPWWTSPQLDQMRQSSEFLWRLQREWFRTAPMADAAILTVAGVLAPTSGNVSESDDVVPAYGAVFPLTRTVPSAYELNYSHLMVSGLPLAGNGAIAYVQDITHPSYQYIQAFRGGTLGTTSPPPPPYTLTSGLLDIRFETPDGKGFDFCSYIRPSGEPCNPVRLIDANTGTRHVCQKLGKDLADLNCDLDDVDRRWGVLVIHAVPPGSYRVQILPDYRGLWTPAPGKSPLAVTAGRPAVVRCDFLSKGQATQSGPCVNATPEPSAVLALP